ncbi:hypothetical protein LOY54_13075 [Pseudomonas sp. B21-032]|uniref:hypothetical protein n=1 Tax=Pseudomonas sp. B21-032 TaxID=2895483 RepID=UPI00215E45EF|nr:hypothetical protein [Pseudomonas sp. B21-032]UVL64162.1 hypothetical protein LOY54_13075 [Pseudomonas sp. B21-032]
MTNKLTRESIARVGIQRVDESLLTNKQRQTYSRRLRAIEMKLDGFTGREIRLETNISESEVSRFFARYTTINENGVYWGEAALVFKVHLAPNRRTKPLSEKRSEQQGGGSGALGYTLNKYPVLLQKFTDEVFRQTEKHTQGRNFEKRGLCDIFYDICKTVGIKEDEWPFNQARGARKTVSGLIDEILLSDFSRAALVVGGRTAQIHSNTGTGYEPFLNYFDVFDLIEIDSYKVDAFFVLNISGDKRVKTKDVINRIWIIAAICKASGAILAIKFVFSSEIRSQDLVDLICEAYLGNWIPRKTLAVNGLAYSADGGMPCYAVPELRYHTWGAVALDNAMQHHANKVYELALHRIGFAINFGPLGQPARRPNVERLFKRIATKVMHQLPSTTGSSPGDGDGRAERPEEAAILYQVDVDDALEVMDVYTANYNGVPQGGKNKANSPLDIIRAYTKNITGIIPASLESYISTAALGSLTREVTIRGNIKNGIRPRIVLDKATYTSVQLANSPQLIGKKAVARINPADYRTVELYLKDGVHLGVVMVEAAWRGLPHSVTTRKLINRALEKKEFKIVAGQDPIIAWQKHLRENANPKNNREQKRVQHESESSKEQAVTARKNMAPQNSATETTERWKKLGLFD